MFAKPRLALLFAVLLAACATPARTVPLDLDAANPDADETPSGPPITPLPTLAPEPEPAPVPVEKPKGAFSCPMHPEVTSDKAGDRCPKCGMELK